MCLVLKFSGKWIVRTQNFQPFRCQPLLTLPAVQPLWNFVISWTRFTEMKIYSDSTSLNFFSPFFFMVRVVQVMVSQFQALQEYSHLQEFLARNHTKCSEKTTGLKRRRLPMSFSALWKIPLLLFWLIGSKASWPQVFVKTGLISYNQASFHLVLFSSGNFEELDKALVHIEPWTYSAVQERQI